MSEVKNKWLVPKMWEDGECWILGGGPSLPRQFGVPEETITEVAEKKSSMDKYSNYLSPIHDKHIIGTNVSYLLGNWVSVLYFCDLPFFRSNKHLLYNFHNLKITDTGNMPTKNAYQHKRIKKLRRDNRYGISMNPSILKWNHHAGGGAINLAALFGCKRILLLGFDMKPDDSGRTHFHSGLANYPGPTRDITFTRFLKSFPQLAEDAKRHKIEILNVCPESAITSFPKVQLKDVL